MSTFCKNLHVITMQNDFFKIIIMKMFSLQMSLIVTHKSLVALVRNGVGASCLGLSVSQLQGEHLTGKTGLIEIPTKSWSKHKKRVWLLQINNAHKVLDGSSNWMFFHEHHAQNTSGGKVAQGSNRSGTLLLGRKREKYLKQGMKDPWLTTKSI